MEEDPKYQVLEEIGRGSFGIIRKVRRKSDNLILCRKEIYYKRMSIKEREQLQAELQILKDLRHPNIVAYYERVHLKATSGLLMYMEYCGNGDLGKVIADHKQRRVYADEEFVWTILSQLITALYRCHYGENPPEVGKSKLGLGPNAAPVRAKTGQTMILHRDLKPDNVFLASDNSVKLGDFGLSKIMSSHDFASTYVGTPYYMSPEICAAERYTLHSDIWSLGCIIYELCAWDPPFNARTHFDLIQKIKSGKYPPMPKVYSQELQTLVAQCLIVNPDRRPDTMTLLNNSAVRLMRKECEVVQFANQITQREEAVRIKEQEFERRLASVDDERKIVHQTLETTVRKEWEHKAHIEINRHIELETKRLQSCFQDEVLAEVGRRVDIEVEAKLALMKHQDTNHEPQEPPPTKSFSTVGEASELSTSTDPTDLSMLSPTATSTKKAKSFARTPYSRSKTVNHACASPMDIQMVDPSPMLHGRLGVSPVRNGGQANVPVHRANIFAGTKPRWELDQAADSSDDDGPDLKADESDDDVPSPLLFNDPLKRNIFANKGRPGMLRQQTLPAGARQVQPQLKMKTHNAVPVVATSPTRTRNKFLAPNDTGSPMKLEKTVDAGSGLKSKKGNNDLLRQMSLRNGQPSSAASARLKKGPDDMLKAATRNQAQLQGRTLVELQQARNVGPQASAVSRAVAGSAHSDTENDRKSGPFSIPRSRGGYESDTPAVWDESVDEMPSPFLKRTRKILV